MNDEATRARDGRLERLLSWHEPIGRRDYVVAGALLMALKFALDWGVARFAFGRDWTMGHYAPWAGVGHVRDYFHRGDERAFALALLFVALPFIWAGIALTVKRLRAAGQSTIWALFFFVPWLNLFLFALLAVLPDHRPAAAAPAVLATSESPRLRALHAVLAERQQQSARRWSSAARAIAVGVVLATSLAAFATTFLEVYGSGLFVGVPFLLGFAVAYVHTRAEARTLRECLGVTMVALLFTGGVLLLVAFEGAVCLAMALPLAAVVAAIGASFGLGFERASSPPSARCLAPVALAPLLMAIEALQQGEPELRVVTTEVVVDASAEAVWRHVVSFPPLPEADGWLFRAGIAAPLRAEIEGEGVGAVRRCVFTTGTFVEPIDVWEPPRRLRFQVTDQPEPMREWSPWTIHPPHLEGFLQSRQGEFRLVPQSDGTTLLIGTTWYSNRMAPAAYWGLWSDALIHQIHRQVLDHVARLAEL